MDDLFHILVIDENLINSSKIKEILIEAGYQVSALQSGNETLEFIARHSPDLILLDIIMPGMKGYEVCRRIKASEFYKTPVIFVTEKIDKQNIDAGYEAGGDDYIRKPVTKQELLTRVKMNLEYFQLTKRNHAMNITRRTEIETKLMSVNKMEAIGQLAAGIAHEISSPTQFIRNNVEFINESTQHLIEFSKKINRLLTDKEIDLNQYQKELIDDIEDLDLDFINEETLAAVNETLEGIDRITKIVNAMRTFSHPGNEEKSEVDINEIIKKAIIVSRNEWKYDAKIETDFQLDNLVPVYRDKLSQVILNLIINAAHAIQERGYEEMGAIKIRTLKKDDNTAEIQVEDNGCGIEQSIREKIFEPFFTTKEVGKGTGQGLAVIYNIIVKNHDGKVFFESEPGKGTTFYLQLPVEKIEEAEDEQFMEKKSLKII